MSEVKLTCCGKVDVLRERIEEMCKNHSEVLMYLRGIKEEDNDLDELTIDIMIERMDDIEYVNDLKLPTNFKCECKNES